MKQGQTATENKYNCITSHNKYLIYTTGLALIHKRNTLKATDLIRAAMRETERLRWKRESSIWKPPKFPNLFTISTNQPWKAMVWNWSIAKRRRQHLVQLL